MREIGRPDEAIERATAGGPPQPRVLELHPSPVCQLACDYCHSMGPDRGSTIYGLSTRPLMSMEDYRELLVEFRDSGGDDVVISGGGEPLVYPHAVSLIETAAELLGRVHLYTNGLHPLLRAEDSLGWLSGVCTVRMSYHASMNQRQQGLFAQALSTTCEHRREMPNSVTTISLLVDTLEIGELRRLDHLVPLRMLDGIELRHTLNETSTAKDDTVGQWVAMLRDFGCDKLDWRIDNSSVPPSCAALYRYIVVDPFGGYRVCCMRAHMPDDDTASLGNSREISLSDALARGSAQMKLLGSGACTSCAHRDADLGHRLHRRLAP